MLNSLFKFRVLRLPATSLFIILSIFQAVSFECLRAETAGARRPVIIIDPGHGGDDLGAPGVGGMLEKDVVLAISGYLSAYLQENLNAVVRLTRDQDVFIPLPERTSIANDYEADVFISLHANASPRHKLSGFEIYYLDNTQDAGSKKLAERENTAGQGASSDLGFILSDLIQNHKMPDSIKLARNISEAVDSFILTSWPGTANLGVKKGPFFVLVGAHMPCVLVELFFIDNKYDGEKLMKPAFQKDLAYALYLGIEKFLNQKGAQ